MNSVRNTIFLGALFFLMVGLGLMYFVMNQVVEGVYDVITDTHQNELTDDAYLSYYALKSFIITSFYILVSMFIFLTILSSAIYSQSFQSYMISAFASIFATPIVIFMITSFWNKIVVLGFSFADVSSVFVDNWATIMTINLIAGLISFVFMRRGAIQQ